MRTEEAQTLVRSGEKSSGMIARGCNQRSATFLSQPRAGKGRRRKRGKRVSESIKLRFGRGEKEVRLSGRDRACVLRKPEMPIIEDERAAVSEALQAGVLGSGQANRLDLGEVAAQARSACIAICDITRPVPNHLFLRPTIERLMAAGLPPERITVLIATGLHRPNIGTELRQVVGDDWVLQTVRVLNHFAERDDEHVDLGRTAKRGTSVKIDRRFVEADLRIATGLIEPHFMAGYSGGRKVIAPGLAHADTIRTFHNHAFMSDPAATNCNLRNNPLHEEQLEIVGMLGGAWAINTVIDEQRRLSFVNFGEIRASHQLAVAFVQDYCRIQVDRSFDVVVTSAAGYPLDQTYYQTVKGMVGPLEILKPGGNLFVLSECKEGLGSDAYRAAQQRLTQAGPIAFLSSLVGKPLADIDAWQTQMQIKATELGRVHLLSELSAEDRYLTGVTTYASLGDFQQALDQVISAKPNCRVAVIPEGPYVIPHCQPSADPPLAP